VLAALALLAGCVHVTGKPSDSPPADSGTSTDTGACEGPVNPYEIATPLQRAGEAEGDEGLAARWFGQVLLPAFDGGQPGVWAQTDPAACEDPEVEYSWCGAYLLGASDWDAGILPPEVEPLLFAGDDIPDGQMALVETDLVTSFGPEGEGLLVLTGATPEEGSYHSWRVFGGAPSGPTDVYSAPLTLFGSPSSEPTVGDVDGDGIDDFLARPAPNAGELVVHLAPDPGVRDAIRDGDATLLFDIGDDPAFVALALADLDGDGYGDLAFILDSNDGHPLYVRAGPLLASPISTAADSSWYPTESADSIGENGNEISLSDARDGLEAVPDVTGDGLQEILISTETNFDKTVNPRLRTFILDQVGAGAHSIEELPVVAGIDDGHGNAVGLMGTGDLDGDGVTDLFLQHLEPVYTDWVGLAFLGPVTGEGTVVELSAPLSWADQHTNAAVVGDLTGTGMTSWVFMDHAAYDAPSRLWLADGCGRASD
jgi:hypothetical protein